VGHQIDRSGIATGESGVFFYNSGCGNSGQA